MKLTTIEQSQLRNLKAFLPDLINETKSLAGLSLNAKYALEALPAILTVMEELESMQSDLEDYLIENT